VSQRSPLRPTNACSISLADFTSIYVETKAKYTRIVTVYLILLQMPTGSRPRPSVCRLQNSS
jgi:hypothetical protein